MKQIGVVALVAFAMLPLGCASGVHLDTDPMATGQKIDRIGDLSMAIDRSPRDPELYAKRALAYENNGEYKTAIADLDQAILIKPDNPQYRFLRGIAYAYAGDDSMAQQEFERAMAMDPGSYQSYNARAWLMATAPDAQLRNGKKAVEYATKACEMTNWQDPDVVGTLAAAYAETGDFDNAIKWQQKSIDLTSTTLLVTLDERKARLALYQNHQPWRPTQPNHPLTPS
ncbi:MAG TPA: tetratricopeptide repeat protein [Candidatus Binataceae bacterium]|nr:tetratricopeptide repeat protein [Candidatus Binataceae bacterium]